MRQPSLDLRHNCSPLVSDIKTASPPFCFGPDLCTTVCLNQHKLHSSGLRENQFSPKLNCSSDAIISPGQHCYFIHFVWRAYSRKDSTGTFISFSSDALHYVFSFSRLQLFRAGGRNLHLISSCWLICPRESSEVWIKATRQSVNQYSGRRKL